MRHSAAELARRLTLARQVLARSAEPLQVPLGVVFAPVAAEAHLEAWAEHARRAAAGETFAAAALYVHIPFCARVCSYCMLSPVRLTGAGVLAAYVDALVRNVDLLAPAVGALRFGSLHIGGGTPTLLDAPQLDRLFGALARLRLEGGAQIGVEAHPATATPDRLQALRRHGVGRLSFGVETLTPAVLAAVNRADQTLARVQAAIARAKELGFSVNLDLLAGLPGETEASFAETVRGALALAPDSLSVNRFLGERSALAASGHAPDEQAARRADAMLLAADAIIHATAPPRWPPGPLPRPGFGTQYVWDRSPAARRYFQADMIGPVSTLAIGPGALGHIFGRCFSVTSGSIPDYFARLGRGALPDVLASAIDERFEMAFYAAEQAGRGELSAAGFARIFGRELGAAFPEEIGFLLRQGYLVWRGDRLCKPPRPDFQTLHLLVILLHDARSLTARLQELPAAGLPVLAPPRDDQLVLDELPLSMLWSQLAVRASQASRGGSSSPG